MSNIVDRAIRGGAARFLGHAARAAIRLGTLMILARLLDPSDFGLIAMVTAVTAIFEVFATGGLSAATIQRPNVSHAQVSTLFWFNVLLGLVLMLICLATIPLLKSIYNDPRTTLIVAALAPAFLIRATGIQHLALLQRDLRYGSLAVIEVASEVVAAVVAIAMALSGFGYWSIVAALIVGPITITVGAWLSSGWKPGLPRRDAEVLMMLRFGGAVTLYGLLVYFLYNVEKIFIGRQYGSEALGLYGKAYELIHLPERIIGTSIGMVAFASLARMQDEPDRLKAYFLKGYGLIAAIMLPLLIGCALFAKDIILVVLGSKWVEATDIFLLLVPSAIVLALVQPVVWLLMVLGLQERNLKVSTVLAPIVLIAYAIGLSFGPTGVALAFSAAMIVWLVPYITLALRDTAVSPWDLTSAMSRPLMSTIAATIVVLLTQPLVTYFDSALVRFLLGGSLMMAVYAVVLLYVFKQRDFYFGIIRVLLDGVTASRRVRPEAPEASSDGV